MYGSIIRLFFSSCNSFVKKISINFAFLDCFGLQIVFYRSLHKFFGYAESFGKAFDVLLP